MQNSYLILIQYENMSQVNVWSSIFDDGFI